MNTASLEEHLGERSSLTLSKKQLSVLSSGPRMELLMALRLDNLSAAELARITGRSQTSLYYHLQQLVEAELVEIKETRMASRREEIVYGLITPYFQPDHDLTDPEYREQCARYVDSVLKIVNRHYRATIKALTGSLADEPGLIFENFHGWLTEDDVARIRVTLDELAHQAKTSQDRDGRQYTFAAVLTPVTEPKRRSRNG